MNSGWLMMPYSCLSRAAALSSSRSLRHRMNTHWWYVVLADGFANLMRKSCVQPVYPVIESCHRTPDQDGAFEAPKLSEHAYFEVLGHFLRFLQDCMLVRACNTSQQRNMRCEGGAFVDTGKVPDLCL